MQGLFLRRGFPERYTITFDGNGGTGEATAVETDYSGKLSYLPSATRDGYTFEGWFTAASGGTQITADTVFTEDTTVYAQWTVQTIAITVTGTGLLLGETMLSVTAPNGTVYTGAGSFEAAYGSTVTVMVKWKSGYVTLNGTTVHTNTSGYNTTYQYTVTKNATIHMQANFFTEIYIAITEE